MRQNEGKRKKWFTVAGILFLLLCIGMTGEAKATRTVNVAFFPMEGFHEYSQDGTRAGMDVEYLSAVNEFAEWDIQYVDCENWDDALQMLRDGRVDLVGSAQYSQDRAEVYRYAEFPSGYTFGAIMVNGDSTCAYEDFEVMDELTYGVVKTYIRKEEFLEYLEAHGVSSPDVKEYEDTAALQDALEKGKVDAIVHTYMEIQEGQRIIGRFSPAPFYYISGKENKALMEELDQALSDLKMKNPVLENTLMNKYYSSKLNQTEVLTTAEKSYVAGVESIVVGYVEDYYPFSYEAGGEYKGLTREVFDELSVNTGLVLSYQKAENMQDALEQLQAGSIDVLAYCIEREEELLKRKLTAATVYANAPLGELLGTQQWSEEVEGETEQERSVLVAIRADEDERLAGVLDKGIRYIDDRSINEYIRKNPLAVQLTLGEWIREHAMLISGMLIVTVTVILMVVLKLLYDSRKMQQLLYKDAELGIWNLNYFTYAGEHLLVSESKSRFAIVCINVVQFRMYSTLYGWQAGNRLLQVMAELLAQNTEGGREIYARNHGDRFVMMLSLKSKEGFMERLEELEEKFEQKLQETSGIHMVVCMGVYYLKPGSSDIKSATDMANQALEFLRDSSISKIRVYDDNMDELVRKQHEQEELLERADINKDFTVYYQEKVDIRTRNIIGAEALVRFLDPTEGGKVRSPGFFIPYYEKTGRIKEIDFFVLNNVCAMLRRLLDAGNMTVPISCNFSRRHFAEEDFPEKLESVLIKYQIPKELIEVEITETIVIEEMQQKKLKDTLDRLKEKGIRLSIDDFGSGYSSLGVFEQVPASVIKLDRSFLLNHTDRVRQVKIMRQIVRLADTLDTQVVCEGVENEEDVKLMTEIGAYVAQGFYYARPVPGEIFESKLAAEKK